MWTCIILYTKFIFIERSSNNISNEGSAILPLGTGKPHYYNRLIDLTKSKPIGFYERRFRPLRSTGYK